MQTFKKILVPIDESEHAKNAFRYALGLAHTQGAHLALLHCYPRIPMLIGGAARTELVGEYVKQTETLLAPFVAKLHAISVEPVLIIKEGRPDEVILEEAEHGGYDLIVIGAHGGTDLGGVLLGSTTHRVLAAASCPVLVAR